MPPGAPERRRTRPRARSTSGAPARSARLLGDDAPIVEVAVRHRGRRQRPADPQGEFTGKNLLYTAATVDEIVATTGKAAADDRRRTRSRTTARSFARAARPAAPASRRQGPHRLERPDDRRVRARGARAAEPGLRARGCSRGPPRDCASVRRRSCATHLWDADRGCCCAAIATATRRSTATPRTTRLSRSVCSSCSRPAATRSGSSGRIELQARLDELFWDRSTADGSAPTGHDPSVLVRAEGGLRRRRAVAERHSRS